MIENMSEIIEEIHPTKGNLFIDKVGIVYDSTSNSKHLIFYRCFDKLDRVLHDTSLTEILIHLANRGD